MPRSNEVRMHGGVPYIYSGGRWVRHDSGNTYTTNDQMNIGFGGHPRSNYQQIMLSERFKSFLTELEIGYISISAYYLRTLLLGNLDFDRGRQLMDKVFPNVYSITETDDGYIIFNEKSKIKMGKLLVRVATELNLGMDKQETMQIEHFVDKYKSWYKGISTLSFKSLKGDKIKIGYDTERQVGSRSMLSGSCMNNKFNLLDLYADNEDKVELLTIVDGKDRIHGRAFLWKLDNRPFIFMDRVYGVDNYITNMFHEYAKKNKMAYRSQEQSYDFDVFLPTNDNERSVKENAEKYSLEVKLHAKHLELMPYMDSLYIWNKWNGVFSTVSGSTGKYCQLKETRGDTGRERIKVLGIRIK